MIDYLWVNIKTIFRIPLSVFFSVAYPILMTTIMMMSYGNPDIGEGFHLVDKYVMVMIGMGILPLTLVSFPIWVASDIEDKSMKRMLYYKVKFRTIIVSELLAHLIVAFVCMVTDILFAKVAFGLNIPSIGHILAFVCQYMVAVIVCILFGLLIALLIPKTQVLMPAGLISMFTMYMLCGAFVSYEQLPSKIHIISSYFPIKYAMNDFLKIWMEKQYIDLKFGGLSICHIAILLIIIILIYYKKYSHWRKE